jgi:hypothetical protein
MKALLPVLNQAWAMWKSDSRAETVLAIVVAALGGVVVFMPQVKSLLQRLL